MEKSKELIHQQRRGGERDHTPRERGANSQERNPIGISEAGSQPLGAVCRGQAISRGRGARPNRAPPVPVLQPPAAVPDLAASQPSAPCLGPQAHGALSCRHVCRSHAAPRAHLPRDVRSLHLDLPDAGAARPPPGRERQRPSKRAPGIAHLDGRVEGQV